MKIVRFLSTKSPLFLGYDVMLRQILSLMGEPVITFRQKGLKALAAILEADPSTLADVPTISFSFDSIITQPLSTPCSASCGAGRNGAVY